MKELTAATKQLSLQQCSGAWKNAYNHAEWATHDPHNYREYVVDYKYRYYGAKRKWTKTYVAVPSELTYEHFVFPEDVHHPQFCHDLKEKFGEHPAKVIRAFLQEERIPMEHCHWLQAPTQAPKPSEHLQADA